MTSSIKCENVCFDYEIDENNTVEVLKNVSVEIKEGEFVALVGKNGCGKSTLSKHFNAILLPKSGKVLIDDMDTTDESKKLDIRRKVGLVLQNPDNQIVATIVEEDVAFGPENLGLPPEKIRERVDWALKAVGMYEYREHAPHKLSGGQKQRVAVASVIAMRPKFIILDEPTAMLDPRGRSEVMDCILSLNKNENISIVLITHNMDEAALADRIIAMEDGQIVMDAPPHEVFTHIEAIKSLGLDVPPVTQLAFDLRKKGISMPQDILHVNQCVNAILSQIKPIGNAADIESDDKY